MTFWICSVVTAEIRTRQTEQVAFRVTQRDKSKPLCSIPNQLAKVVYQSHPQTMLEQASWWAGEKCSQKPMLDSFSSFFWHFVEENSTQISKSECLVHPYLRSTAITHSSETSCTADDSDDISPQSDILQSKDVENSSVPDEEVDFPECSPIFSTDPRSYIHWKCLLLSLLFVSFLTEPCKTQYKCSERQVDRKDRINS